MNPIYNAMSMGGRAGNMMQLAQQFQQFRRTFMGDPNVMLQNLIQSGRVSQEQLNQAQAMAQQFGRFM